jgi:hypothetical protein
MHASEVPIVFFGNLDAVAFPEFHDDVQEVHAVEFHLFAKRLAVVKT